MGVWIHAVMGCHVQVACIHSLWQGNKCSGVYMGRLYGAFLYGFVVEHCGYDSECTNAYEDVINIVLLGSSLSKHSQKFVSEVYSIKL